MNGPSTVLDAAFKMQREYITGMDHDAEGAKNVFETYTEICTQLDDEIPKYVQMYLKGMSKVVLWLSTAQAEYYDNISKIFEMVFKEKGLEGDRESYRRDRPNGEAPKLRAFSVYQAIAENRLPGPKELGYGLYGCDGGNTRQIWEEAAGEYLSRLGAGVATVEDRLKECLEWGKKHKGESSNNTSVSSLLSRLTNKGRVSIGSRSTPALNEMRASPISTPLGTPPGAWLNGQCSPSPPILASFSASGNLRFHQGPTEQMVPIAPPLQRTMTAPSTMGLSHSPPARAQLIPLGHLRSRSHGYPLAINKSLPGTPSSSKGLVTGIPASPPAVPPRPPGGHRRQYSEGQVVMESLRWQPAVPFSNPSALRNQPSSCQSHQPVSAQPATVVASVARPITKQLVKSNLTLKLRDHHKVSNSMGLANETSSIAPQYPPRAKQGRSKSQPRAHHQPQAGAGYIPVGPPLPLRPGVSSAPREDGNQASTSNSHLSNAIIEPSLFRVAHPPPPRMSPTRPSMPLSKSIPSSSGIRSNYTNIRVRQTEESSLPPPFIRSHPAVRRDACVPSGSKAEKSEVHAKNDSA